MNINKKQISITKNISVSTSGSKNDGLYAGTLYGSSENGVTCEGCTNYTASVFTNYSLWIICACSAVIAAAVVCIIIAQKKKQIAK